LPDGEEIPAHAKFAKTTTGTDAAEQGTRGLASELLAALLGKAMGASVPTTEVIELTEQMKIVLRNNEVPESGLAVASHTIDPAIDVPNPDALNGVPIEELARISALESWTEMGDRSHNMIRSGNTAYSIDHASGFGSSWAGIVPPSQLVVNTLTQDRLAADPAARASAADALARVTDEQIDSIVDQVPEAWLGKSQKERFKINLKASRDNVAQMMRGAANP